MLVTFRGNSHSTSRLIATVRDARSSIRVNGLLFIPKDLPHASQYTERGPEALCRVRTANARSAFADCPAVEAMPTFSGNYKNSFIDHAGAWSYAPFFSVHVGALSLPPIQSDCRRSCIQVSTEQSNHCHFTQVIYPLSSHLQPRDRRRSPSNRSRSHIGGPLEDRGREKGKEPCASESEDFRHPTTDPERPAEQKNMDKNIAQFRGPKTQGNIIWSEHISKREKDADTVKKNHRRGRSQES